MTTMFRTDRAKLHVLVPAQTAINSTPVSMERHAYASFHVIWASLTTGTAINATLTVQCSNDPRVLSDPANAVWDTKASALYNVTTANGNKMISLNDVVTEDYYRTTWDGTGVTGGTLSVHMVKKG